MYLADYHTHSRISSDGRVPMAEMAEAAIAAGLISQPLFGVPFQPYHSLYRYATLSGDTAHQPTLNGLLKPWSKLMYRGQ